MSQDTVTKPEQAKAALDFTKLEITSDGTAEGTKITLNGKTIENLAYLGFSFWRTNKDSCWPAVNINFTTSDPKPVAGTLSESCYYSLNAPKCEDDSAEASKRATASLIKRPIFEAPPEAQPRDHSNRQLYAENFR